MADRAVGERHPPQPDEPVSARLEGQPVVDHARIAQASAYAVSAHAGQTRKGTSVHYASHVLGVGALVIEHAGTTEQVIAGLLHDVVEDCGGAQRLEEVRQVFGDTVAELVAAVSDAAPAPGEQKAPWRWRKERYLEHLAHLVDDRSPAVLVSACDRLHNLTAIGEDLDDPAVGTDVFARFNASLEDVLWNHRSTVAVFVDAPDALVPTRLKGRLERALARVQRGAEELAS
jgi:(p)ppGpp synthase/HD superfamily hydrolase